MKETAKSKGTLRCLAQVTVKVVVLLESQEEEQTWWNRHLKCVEFRDPGRHPGEHVHRNSVEMSKLRT